MGRGKECNMKLCDIIKTASEIDALEHGIENNVINSIDINTVGHFGNCVCLEIWCSNVSPMSQYNNTANLGFIIRALIVLLNKENEDGVRLSNLKNIPCRVVFSNKASWGGTAIGIGNFMKDQFVLIKDLVKIDE